MKCRMKTSSAFTLIEPSRWHGHLAHDSRPVRTCHPQAFTLIELLVVISIIAILSLITLPSMVNMFRANADAQAYNMFTVQLAAARAHAVRTSNYVLVHVQQVDPNNPPPGMKDRFFAVVMERNSATGNFKSAPGFAPMMLPGSIAFGKVTPPFALPNSGADRWEHAVEDPTNFENFTTFSIIFSPSGTLVPKINGVVVDYDSSDPVFNAATPATRIWDYNKVCNKPNAGSSDYGAGVSVVALFDWAEAKATATYDRYVYMNYQSGGQYIAINAYTGQPFRRR